MNAPAILQTTPSTIKYAGLPLYYANVKAAAKLAKVPIALHLDHGNSFSLAMQALRVGYTSIMIDGSHEDFDDNILLTQSVVKAPDAPWRTSGIFTRFRISESLSTSSFGSPL